MAKYRLLMIVVALMAINSCKGGGQAIKTYEGVGVVVSVDRTAGMVQIKHEDIKGFMTAMTMSFKARRPSLLDGISVGDNVEFTLRDDGSGVVLVKIEKTAPAPVIQISEPRPESLKSQEIEVAGLEVVRP